MGKSLLDKARRLQQVAGEVKAVRSALDDALRLQNRAKELEKALVEPEGAAQTWCACAAAGVNDLRTPDVGRLAQAVADLRLGLNARESPADLDSRFDIVKRALVALGQQTNKLIAEAWPRFANARAEQAGIHSVRLLPPTVRRELADMIAEIEKACREVPRNRYQVDHFLRRVDWLRREVNEVGRVNFPSELETVFEALNDEGFPLRELTAEQLRLLQEHGYADDLVVRWRS